MEADNNPEDETAGKRMIPFPVSSGSNATM